MTGKFHFDYIPGSSCSACWLHACFLKFFCFSVWLPGASNVVPASSLICHTVQHLTGEVFAGLGRGTGWGQALTPCHPDCLTHCGVYPGYWLFCFGSMFIIPTGRSQPTDPQNCAFQGVKCNKQCCFQRSTVNLISTTSAGHSVKNRMCDF